METERNLAQSMKRLNSASLIRREDVLKIFNSNSIEKCWEVFCKSILKNYRGGKGTSIPKFGIFTFSNAEVNLEGTTNQFNRDLKARRPVFIVSSDFVSKVKPGIFNNQNGVVYYTQKQSNSINHVKVNYAEMAYSLNMKKEEVNTIVDNLIKFIGDSISRNEFKNKEMGELGTLIIKSNILAVKFNQDLIENIKLIPQKLIQTKKEVNLFMELNENNKSSQLGRSFTNIRPKTALITKITNGGEKWLKENYDIDLENLDDIEEEKDNFNPRNNNKQYNLINDIKPKTLRIPQKLEDLKIDSILLESIYFHKGVILSEMKNADKNNTGILRKSDFVNSFILAKVNHNINSQLVNEVLNLYTDTKIDFINYTTTMASILKDIQFLMNQNKKNTRSMSSSNFRPNTARQSISSLNKMNNINTNSINKRKVELEEISKEIKTIKLIINKIKQKFSTSMDQNKSISEFINIFRDFSIVLTKPITEKILNFLEIDDHSSFSLQEFCFQLNKCKILSQEMTSEEIIKSFHKLKDFVYALGGKQFIFNSQNSINKSEFVNLFKNKGNFSIEILESIFTFLTKTDKEFTIEDYEKHFELTRLNNLDEDFEIKAIEIINTKIHKSGLKHDEYFNHLLSYKRNKSEIYLNRVEFHKSITNEKFPFSAEEIDYLFNVFDYKKDNKIDRQEFNQLLNKVYKALYKIADIIKNNNLEIEDLMYRMNLDINQNEKMDFFKFKSKLKTLDPTFSHEFIESLFNEMKNKNINENFVETKTLLKEFNVFKKENFNNLNTESFRQNFIKTIRNVTSYSDLKLSFEKIDTFNNGFLTKVDFCNIILKTTQDYKEEDIMKFARISSLIQNSKINYPQFLEIIFNNSKENKFIELVDKLSNFLIENCNKDINMLFAIINSKSYKKAIGNVIISNEFITIEKMNEFLLKKLNLQIDKNLVCKLDLDMDGKISVDDMKAILERYKNTLFFKFENSDKLLEVNLYANEVLNEEKFKQIVKDIKHAMKMKNITEIGLFNKLDNNKDGFVSQPEFCKKIDEVIDLAPGIKDKFFNYLDVRNLGLVDLETFLKRFKEFKSNDVIVKNNWDIEFVILNQFSQFILKNTKLIGDELFATIDYDCDGIIGVKDFKQFIIEKLNFSQFDFDECKLERVMQRISITKNKNIGLADLKDFIIRCRSGSLFEELSSKLTSTAFNLNDKMKNQDWIDEAITKLGLFVSENYDSIEQFFDEIVSKNSGKMRIDEFKHFIEKQHKCFDGFNFTTDEITTIFSAMDPHKKSHISLEDLKNKLYNFDFYKKMHLDIKSFIKENFLDGLESFKYFKKEFNSNDKINSVIMSKKEMFKGLNNLFPGKYQTNTILKYIKKKFKNEEEIPFSEFNYLFFDEVKKNEILFNKSTINMDRIKSGKLTMRTNAMNQNLTDNNNLTRAKSANHLTKSRKREDPKFSLATPFDEDALEKVRRIIHSSRFDFSSFFKMYELLSDKGLLNQFEFRNMLKKLNLGLTTLEIDQIISKSGKTRDGRINIKDFSKFLRSE